MSSIFSAQDNKLLDELRGNKSPIVSKRTVQKLVDLCQRQREEIRKERRMSGGFVVAAFGMMSADDIAKNEGLDKKQREQLLLVRQMHDDAQAWRAQRASPAPLDLQDIASVQYRAWYREAQHTGMDKTEVLCALQIGAHTEYAQAAVDGESGQDWRIVRQLALQLAINEALEKRLITVALAMCLHSKCGGYGS